MTQTTPTKEQIAELLIYLRIEPLELCARHRVRQAIYLIEALAADAESARETALDDALHICANEQDVYGIALGIADRIRALKSTPAPTMPSAPAEADGPRRMKMADVKVGDRLVSTIAGGPAFSPITVTKITERGFQYKLDAPVCLHPLMGTTEGGEHFGHDGECFYVPSPPHAREGE